MLYNFRFCSRLRPLFHKYTIPHVSEHTERRQIGNTRHVPILKIEAMLENLPTSECLEYTRNKD